MIRDQMTDRHDHQKDEKTVRERLKDRECEREGEAGTFFSCSCETRNNCDFR